MQEKEIDSLLSDQNSQLHNLHNIVRKTIKEQKLLVTELSNQDKEKLTVGQKISDEVARFGGSWKFIIIFMIVLCVWILANALLSAKYRFDPYPFILMNLVLSCIAALQAPVIMMSQNRQEEKDRKRSENDYMVNLKAEIELRSLQSKMDLLLEKQLTTLFDIQKKQFDLLKEIEARLEEKK